MSVEALLSKLEKVKRTGNGRWMACCPHHEDKSPSMTVAETDDGRVLIHCFAGCPPASILGSVGMTFEELFPERLPKDRYQPIRKPFNAHDILAALQREITITRICAAKLAAGNELSPTDRQRFDQACARIAQAEEMSNGR